MKICTDKKKKDTGVGFSDKDEKLFNYFEQVPYSLPLLPPTTFSSPLSPPPLLPSPPSPLSPS
jgi:hypothetical protein